MKTTSLLFIFIILLCTIDGKYAKAYECVADTYQDASFEVITENFDAEDKVYIKINCKELSPGEHTISVNWIKEDYGAVRQDSRKISVKKVGNRTIYFWLKISKKGLGKRLLGVSDYSKELIGEWVIESYLGDQLIKKNNFTVN